MKKKKVIVCSVFLVAWIMFLTPMIISIFYSLPSADDFSMAVGIENRSNLLVMAIKRANDYYMTWGGSWSGIFLETLFNPLAWFKGNSAIGIFALRMGLLLNLTVFAATFVLLWNSICKNLFNIESVVKRNILSFSIVLGILLGNVYTEIFYWYVGSFYCWYLSFAMLSILEMIEYFFGGQNKDRTLVLLTVWGSLACSLLNFIVPVILIYIFLLLCSIRRGNVWKKKYCLPLAFFFVIGTVTVAAPGNFVRHQVIDDSGIHIIKGCIYTIIASVKETLALIRRPSIMLILFLFLVVGCWLYGKKCVVKVHPFWGLLFWVLAVCGSIFPVAVGYSNSHMPNRIQFMFDVQWLAWGCLLAVSVGYYLSKYFDVKEMNSIYLVLMLVCFMFIEAGNYRQTAYYQIMDNMEKFAYEANEWRDILKEIEYSPNDDVKIVHDKIPESFIIKNPELGRDEEYWSWVNEAVAGYYGKKSVLVVWAEEE